MMRRVSRWLVFIIAATMAISSILMLQALASRANASIRVASTDFLKPKNTAFPDALSGDKVQLDQKLLSPPLLPSLSVSTVTSFSVSFTPTTAFAGEQILTFTVEARDVNNNIVTDYLGGVEFFPSALSNIPDLHPPIGNSPDYTFQAEDAGRAVFSNITFYEAGQQSVLVEEYGNPTVNGTSNDVDINEVYLVAAISPTIGIASGPVFTLTVEAQDENGDIWTGFRGRVEFVESVLSTLPDHHPPIGNSPDYTFQPEDAGKATFNFAFRGAGQQNVYIYDYDNAGGRNTTTNDVEVREIYLSAIISPTVGIARDPVFTLTVEARDISGTLQPDYAGGIEIEPSTTAVGLPQDDPTFGNNPDDYFEPVDGGRLVYTNFSFEEQGQQNVHVYELVFSDRDTTSNNVEVTGPPPPTPSPPGPQPASYTISNPLNIPLPIIYNWGIPFAASDEIYFSQWEAHPSYAIPASENTLYLVGGQGEWRTGPGLPVWFYVCPYLAWENPITSTRPSGGNFGGVDDDTAFNIEPLGCSFPWSGGIGEISYFGPKLAGLAPADTEGVHLDPSGGGNTYGQFRFGLNSAFDDSLECDVPNEGVPVGDPIDTRSGEFYLTEQDFGVETGCDGVSLRFERSYRSMGIVDRPFGPGWTHNYNQAVINLGNDYVIVRRPRGSHLLFEDVGGGVYATKAGANHTLVKRSGGGWALVRQDRKVALFDSDGRLIAEQDAHGNLIWLTYEEYERDGQEGIRLARVDAPGGRYLWFGYDYYEPTVLTQVSDHTGRTVTYYYNDSGFLTGVRDRLGGVTEYTYSNWYLSTKTGPLGNNVFDNGYDSGGRVLTQTNYMGQSLSLVYNWTTTTLTATVTEETTGAITHYAYGAGDGLLQRIIDAYGQETQIQEYNLARRPTEIMDALSRSSGIAYNTLALPTVITDALEHETRIFYDSFNNITKTIDARNQVTVYEFEDSTYPNFMTSQMDAANHTTLYTPTVAGVDNTFGGLVKSVQDPKGQLTSYTYSSNGQVLMMVRGAGTTEAMTTTYSYDSLGRVITETQTSLIESHTIFYAYDTGDRLIATIANWDGSLDWGNCDFSVGIRDENACTLYRYDAIGRIISTTNGLGQTELTIYDDEEHTVLTVTNYDGSAFVDPLTDLCNFVSPDPTFNLCTLTEYDAYGRTVAFTNTIGIKSVTEYDLRGQVRRTVENWEDGIFSPSAPDTDVETLYQYDEVGNTVIVTDTLGRMTRTFYDELNRVIGIVENWKGTITSTSGLVNCIIPSPNFPERRDHDICTRYQYDEVGNTIIVTDTLGRMTRTFFDELNRVETSVQNWNPATLTLPADCVYSATNANDENICITYAYDDAGNQTTVTNALDQRSLTVYDTLDRPVVQVANWDGATVIDEPGDCTFNPEAVENLCTVTTYDNLGRRSTSKNPLGQVTIFGYDGLGRIVTTTRNLSGQAVSTYTYFDALGNRLQSVDANNHITYFIYDEINRLIQATSPEGVVNYTFYDAAGRVVSTTNNLGEVTRNQYDDLGRLVSTFDPISNTTTSVYDGLGNQVAMVDAENVRTGYQYDELNRLVAVLENWDNSAACSPGSSAVENNLCTQYVYDALGNRVVVTNALAVSTTLTVYDDLNRPVLSADALGNETTYAYDALGNRTVMTDANEAVTYRLYDGLNRTISTTYASDGETVLIAYDALGNRTVMTDALGTTAYVYDDLNRLITVTNPFTGTVGYGYDNASNRTRLTYPDSNQVTYDFDADNRLITVTSWLTGTTSYAYDPAGRLVTTTLPNGVLTVSSYDAAGRLTNLYHETSGGTALANFVYELDKVGNRTVATETIRLPDGEFRLQSEVAATTQGDSQRTPAVAYNADDDEYLVVWVDGRDAKLNIYAQRFAGDGSTIGSNFAVYTSTTEHSDLPDVAYSPHDDEYMVVWETGPNSYYLALEADGDPIGSPQNIMSISGSNRAEHPAVVYNPVTHDFMAAWRHKYDKLGATWYEILAWPLGDMNKPVQLVDTSGPLGFDLAYPDLSVNDDGEYLVTWQFKENQPTASHIYGRLLDEDGGTIGNAFVISDTGYEEVQSAVSWLDEGNAYLVAWNKVSQGVYGQRVNSSGSLVGSAVALSDSAAAALPALDTLHGNWLTAWQQSGDLYGQVVDSAGLASGDNKALATQTGDQQEVALATGNVAGYGLLAWRDNRNENDDIYTRLIAPPIQTTRIDYTYDPLYRLTNAVYTGAITATFAYIYDGVGNMTAYSETVGVEETTYVVRTFDDANQLVVAQDVEAGTTSFLYDQNGNLIQVRPPGETFSGTLRYGYNQRNLLITNTLYVTGTGWVSLTAYVYDGDNNRVQQIIFDNGTPVTTTYHNDISGLSQVLVADAGATQTQNLFGLDLILQDDGNEVRTLLADGLGSVRTEMVGDVIDVVTMYEPFGNLIVSTGTNGTVYGYTGEQHDANGLIFLRARYYNPRLRVFMSRDPFQGVSSIPASQHAYSYAHNNPVNLIDPNGEFAQAIGLGVGPGGGLLGACLANPPLCLVVALGAVVVTDLIVNGARWLYEHIEWDRIEEGGERIAAACQASIEDLVNAEDLDFDEEPDPKPNPVRLGPDWIPRRSDPPDDGKEDILTVGDGNFSYSINLARAHPNWNITGTNYGNGSNYRPEPVFTPGNLNNLVLYRNIDATRLGSDSITKGKQYDAIVFNAPRAANVPIYRKAIHGDLVDSVLASALNVLGMGGQMRFSSSGGMPATPRLQDRVKPGNWPHGYSNAYKGTSFFLDPQGFGVSYQPMTNENIPLSTNLKDFIWYVFVR